MKINPDMSIPKTGQNPGIRYNFRGKLKLNTMSNIFHIAVTATNDQRFFRNQRVIVWFNTIIIQMQTIE